METECKTGGGLSLPSPYAFYLKRSPYPLNLPFLLSYIPEAEAITLTHPLHAEGHIRPQAITITIINYIINFRRSLRVASPRNFAHARVCISPAPQSPSPKLETTRSLG